MWNSRVLITEKLLIITGIHHDPTVILQNKILSFLSNSRLFLVCQVFYFLFKYRIYIIRRILYNVQDFIRYNKHYAHNFSPIKK